MSVHPSISGHVQLLASWIAQDTCVALRPEPTQGLFRARAAVSLTGPHLASVTCSAKVAAMKVPFTIGTVGHFGLAVRDPRRSAKWFVRVLGLRKEFEFEEGVAVGNDNVTIVLFER